MHILWQCTTQFEYISHFGFKKKIVWNMFTLSRMVILHCILHYAYVSKRAIGHVSQIMRLKCILAHVTRVFIIVLFYFLVIT